MRDFIKRQPFLFRDLDEETQIALALSASIAPFPLHSDPCTKKTVKVKGGKKRG